MVREEGTAWNPESGQLQIDFAAGHVAHRPGTSTHHLVRSPDPAVETFSASYWFDLGVDLEARAPEEARRAYTRALALDPDLVEAHVNLGRLYEQLGRGSSAVRHPRAYQLLTGSRVTT